MTLAKKLHIMAKNLTVLYAEDEEEVRANTLASLKRLFGHVLVAADGKEALELFNANQVDLILTDLNMPNMTGIELITEIKRDKDNQNLPPIIVLTAYNEQKYLIDLIHLNIDSFLLKPVEKQSMLEALYKVCSNIQNKQFAEAYKQGLKDSYHNCTQQNRILNAKFDQMVQERNFLHLQEEEIPNEMIEIMEGTEKNYFQTLLDEDLYEIKELSNEIDSCITILFTKEDRLNDEYIKRISYLYKRYAILLNGYSFFTNVGIKLIQLADYIQDNLDNILKSQDAVAIILESLQFSFNTFRKNIWETKADDSTYYNQSLIKDIEKTIDLLGTYLK